MSSLFDMIRSGAEQVVKNTVTKKTEPVPKVKTKLPTGGTTKKPAASAAAAQPAAPVNTSGTDIVTWSGNGGISFFVKPNAIQGIRELSIKASVDSEDKENGGEKYAGKKNNGAVEITVKAELNGYLGADVQAVAMRAVDAARRGETGYFYCYGKKLFGNQFMMMEAEIGSVTMTGSGVWTGCDLTMKMKGCSKGDGAPALNTGKSKPKEQPDGSAMVNKLAEAGQALVRDIATGFADKITGNIAATNTATEQSKKILENSSRRP
jgi:hypothetical protein